MKPETSKNYVAAIHCSLKALGIVDDDACALKLQVTGVASVKEMTTQQRKRFLAHLYSLQTKVAGAGGENPAYVRPRPKNLHSVDDVDDMRWHKARAMWAALARAGVVRVDTDNALMRYVERQTHVSHWRFLNTYQINTTLESLKFWCDRVEAQIRMARVDSPRVGCRA